MRILVAFHGRIADIVGRRSGTLDVENDVTLGEAFEAAAGGLLKSWSGGNEDRDGREPVLVFLNGRLEVESTAVRDGDKIDLVAPNIGG